MSEQTRKKGFGVSALLLIALIAVGLLVGSGDKSNADEDEVTRVTEPSSEEDARECPETWLIVQVDHEENARHRFYDDGLRAIFEADTDEEARDAAHTWLSLVRRDPEYFAGGAVSYFLHRQVDPATLVDAEGKCASALAEQLLAEVETHFAVSRITPSQAPENGYNSGVNDGNVVGATSPGISGDRTAVLIESPNGDKVWILGRCGNPVTEGPPPVPPGETDEPPTTTTTQPPTTTTTQPPTTTTVPPTTTTKPETTEDCQQNGGEDCPFPEELPSPVQENPCCNTGPTPGAPEQPHTPPPGPAPQPSTPAPPPNDGGYDSGSPDGSETPGGSTCDSFDCSGGGPTPPAPGPPPTVEPDPEPIGGDPGGF